MKTCYVVSHVNYEYNDEVYYPPENGGGTPQLVFTDKKLAENKALLLNSLEFQGLTPGNYGYELDEVSSLSAEQIVTKLIGLGVIILRDDDDKIETIAEDIMQYELPDNLDALQLLEVAKIFNKLQFYQVQPVQGDI